MSHLRSSLGTQDDEEVKEEIEGISQSRGPSSQSVVLGLITQVPHRGEVGFGAEGFMGMEGIPDEEDTGEEDDQQVKTSVFDLT